MEEDDDFGDLYTDVLHVSPAPTSLPATQNSTPTAAAAGGGGGGSDSDEEDDKILHGSSLPSAPAQPSSSIDRERQVFAEDAEDDWLLGRDPAPVEEPANWVDDDEEVAVDRDSEDAVRGLSFKGGGARVLEKVDAEEASRISEEERDAADGETSLKKTQELREGDDGLLIPGLATPAVHNGVLVKTSESDDWDSGSEDDLQIVLNDTGHDLLGLERRDGAGSDEDDEDLVIVTDDDQRHHHQAMEEQDWGDDATQSSVDGEKKEMLEVAKASGVVPTVPGAVIGYSNHGFHPQHHSMFKVSYWLAVETLVSAFVTQSFLLVTNHANSCIDLYKDIYLFFLQGIYKYILVLFYWHAWVVVWIGTKRGVYGHRKGAFFSS